MAQNEDALLEWAKRNRKKLVAQFFKNQNLQPATCREAVFMAWSPGAGKTEFIRRGLMPLWMTADFCVLDLDEIRTWIPEYRGGRAEAYSKGAIKILEYLLDQCREKWFNFVLDGTFTSRGVAKKNIDSLLRRGYRLTIFYIHTQPYLAWAYTLMRGKEEWRNIPPTVFIKNYGLARENVIWAKGEYGEKIQTYVVRKWLKSDGKEILEEVSVPKSSEELNKRVDEIARKFYTLWRQKWDRWVYFNLLYLLSKIPFLWGILVRRIFSDLPKRY